MDSPRLMHSERQESLNIVIRLLCDRIIDFGNVRQKMRLLQVQAMLAEEICIMIRDDIREG